MVAALVLIIAGSVAVGVYSCLHPEQGASVPPNEFHYKCGLCGHELVKTPQELVAEAAGGEVVDEEDPRFMIGCPACKGKRCCGQMVKCPECGKHFVPFEFVKSSAEPRAVALGRANNVCPRCKTDRVEWYRKDYERRTKKPPD
ncbi:MAG: hypothetical protein AMJ81_12755 [Phycisphaerae bacterium SM23_33]|nr:MAG: hypothetical protein AMJ81_12755 [Phycisphaerae bacterium SM23_33]